VVALAVLAQIASLCSGLAFLKLTK